DIIIGGIGNDTIDAYSSNGGSAAADAANSVVGNIVVGDNGWIVYNGGPGLDTNDATLDLVQSIAPLSGGGNDVIKTGDGNERIIGGDNTLNSPNSMSDPADTILGGNGDNIVLGDNGQIQWFNGKLDLIQSTEAGAISPAASPQGGDDKITTGTGKDTIIA